MSKIQKLALAAVLAFLFIIAAVASIIFFYGVIEPPAVFQAIIDSIGLLAAVLSAVIVATISIFAFGWFLYKIYRTRAELHLLQSQLNSFASSVRNQSDSTQQEKYNIILLLDLLDKFANNKEIKSLLMSKRDDLISFSVRERDMKLLCFLLINCYEGQPKKASKLKTMFKFALGREINYFSDIEKGSENKDEGNQDLTNYDNYEQKTNDKSAKDLEVGGDTLFLLEFIDSLGETYKLDPSANLNKVKAWAKKEKNIALYMRVLRITKGTNVFQSLTDEYNNNSSSFILDCLYSYTKNIKKEKANCSSRLKFNAAKENLDKIEEFLNKELEKNLQTIAGMPNQELKNALKVGYQVIKFFEVFSAFFWHGNAVFLNGIKKIKYDLW